MAFISAPLYFSTLISCIISHHYNHSILLRIPFGICLPGTELLQSPFKMDFSMRSLSWWYRRSLWRHRCGIVTIPEAIGGCAVTNAAMRIIARLSKHRKISWNIVNGGEPLVKHETLLKHCETSWNTQTLSIRCGDISARHSDISTRAEFLAISAQRLNVTIAVLV